MPKAIWNGSVIAESDATVVVEGNHYFPADSVDDAYLAMNQSATTCAWKGVASYYDITVDGQTNAGAAFTYLEPSTAAADIRGHVAFWKGVEVQA